MIPIAFIYFSHLGLFGSLHLAQAW